MSESLYINANGAACVALTVFLGPMAFTPLKLAGRRRSLVVAVLCSPESLWAVVSRGSRMGVAVIVSANGAMAMLTHLADDRWRRSPTLVVVVALLAFGTVVVGMAGVVVAVAVLVVVTGRMVGVAGDLIVEQRVLMLTGSRRALGWHDGSAVRDVAVGCYRSRHLVAGALVGRIGGRVATRDVAVR